ncbi:MAG: VOC family protein [Cyclobacteriaceae bacterium]|nr:VOC family protein [Cyclobacteriaceae bacterium]
MGYNINGIQQIGLGVQDAEQAWAWYRKVFGMNVPIFRDHATASLMTRYTGDIAHQRYAILAMNLEGGAGLEIWQYTSRSPEASPKIELGDTGVHAVKIKARSVPDAYESLLTKKVFLLSEVCKAPDGRPHFYLHDPYDNLIEVVESKSWFQDRNQNFGGVSGCVIGVSDVDKALTLYRDVLGFKEVVYDESKRFSDLEKLPRGTYSFRRVLLRSSSTRQGAFGKLLGQHEVELIQVTGAQPEKIFRDRWWGDQGYIHVCFDVTNMDDLSKTCAQKGFEFTVDSRNSFDMGKAAGHFAYCEDPDGTLVELVETHKIPIIEKLGWYLNLKKRDPSKPLPNWILKLLSLNRVKD